MARNINRLVAEHESKFLTDTRTEFNNEDLFKIYELAKKADGEISLINATVLGIEIGIMVGYNMRKAEERKHTGPVGSEAAASPQDGSGFGCLDGPGSGPDQIYSKDSCRQARRNRRQPEPYHIGASPK